MVWKKVKSIKRVKKKQGLLEMEEQLKYAIVEANNKGVEAINDECDLVGFSSSFSESGISSGSFLESDSFEEVTSPPCSSSSGDDHVGDDPLSDMSSLTQQLPIKRGLSKYYQGKAQSFTSLAKVSSLEDLVKPENPYNKKMKFCRSYGGKMDETQRAKCTPSAISRRRLHITGSSYSVSTAERGSGNFTRSRPQIPPHRPTSSNNIPNQTALFV